MHLFFFGPSSTRNFSPPLWATLVVVTLYVAVSQYRHRSLTTRNDAYWILCSTLCTWLFQQVHCAHSIKQSGDVHWNVNAHCLALFDLCENLTFDVLELTTRYDNMQQEGAQLFKHDEIRGATLKVTQLCSRMHIKKWQMFGTHRQHPQLFIHNQLSRIMSNCTLYFVC